MQSIHLITVTNPPCGLDYTWVAAKRPLANCNYAAKRLSFHTGGREAATCEFFYFLFAGLPRSGHLRIFNFFAAWPRSGHLLSETKPRSGLVTTQVASRWLLANFFIFYSLGGRTVTEPRSGLVSTQVAAKRPLGVTCECFIC